MTYSVAVVGTGADPDNPSAEGFAMGYRHAEAYESLDSCSVVACADLVRENAAAFARTFDIDDEGVYEDYRQMLAETEPDLVSVCVPPKGRSPPYRDRSCGGSMCEDSAKAWTSLSSICPVFDRCR